MFEKDVVIEAFWSIVFAQSGVFAEEKVIASSDFEKNKAQKRGLEDSLFLLS